MARCWLVDFNSAPSIPEWGALPGDSIGDDRVADFPDAIAGFDGSHSLLSDVVNWQLAKRRSGTAKTKTISEITATTRKPWRQKGTGRARHGNLVAPQFRGGAVAFGPRPRSFCHSINKKVRRKALTLALALKFREGLLSVSNGSVVCAPKTKDFVSRSREYLGNYSSLLYCVMPDDNLLLSSRNVPNVSVLPVSGLNVYDILRSELVVIDRHIVSAVIGRIVSGYE